MNETHIHSKFNLSKVSLRLNREIVFDVISVLYSMMFLYAGLAKLWDYDKFSLQLAKSPFTTEYASLLSWLVPTTEFVISILLLIGVYKREFLFGLYMAFTLMLAFTIYIIALLNFAENIPCGCMGIFEHMTWYQHLFFNAFFLILAVIGLLLKQTNTKTDFKQK